MAHANVLVAVEHQNPSLEVHTQEWHTHTHNPSTYTHTPPTCMQIITEESLEQSHFLVPYHNSQLQKPNNLAGFAWIMGQYCKTLIRAMLQTVHPFCGRQTMTLNILILCWRPNNDTVLYFTPGIPGEGRLAPFIMTILGPFQEFQNFFQLFHSLCLLGSHYRVFTKLYSFPGFPWQFQ